MPYFKYTLIFLMMIVLPIMRGPLLKFSILRNQNEGEN